MAPTSADHHFYQTDEITLKTSQSHLLWSNIFCLLASIALLATSILFLVEDPFDQVVAVAGLTPIFVTILAGFLVLNAVLGLVIWHRALALSTSEAAAAAAEAESVDLPPDSSGGASSGGADISDLDYDASRSAAAAGGASNGSRYGGMGGGGSRTNPPAAPFPSAGSAGGDSVASTSLCALPITTHYLVNVVGILLCLAFTIATVSSFGNINAGENQRSLSTKTNIFRWAFVVVLITNVAALCFAIYGDLSVQWGRRRSAAWGFMLTICVFLLGAGVALVVLNQVHISRQFRWVFVGFQGVGALLLICFILGILTIALGPGMSLDLSVVGFDIGIFVAFLSVIVFVIAGLVIHSKLVSRHAILLEANLVLALIVAILYFTARQVSRVFGARSLPSGLSVEVLDVLSLSPDLKAQWAAAIDRGNGVRHCGAWDGAGALEMMKAYSRRGVPDISGLALHVYRRADGSSPSISSTPTAHAPRDESVALIFITVVEVIDLTRFVKSLACCCGRSSLFKALVVRFMLVGFHWPFTSGVFLVNRNPRGPRRGDPASQIAMALRAAVEYNTALPNAQRAALFLLPAMDTEPVSRALEAETSGFTSAPLPHTALVDLRPHRGKTWHEYLHSLKKGNRREFDRQFYAMGGSIHYIVDTTRDLEDDDNADLEIVEYPDLFYGGKNPYANYDIATAPLRGNGFLARAFAATGANGAPVDDSAASAAAAAAAANEAGNANDSDVREATNGTGTVAEQAEASYPGWNNDFHELWLRIVNHRIANGDFPTLYDLTPRMFLDVAKMDPANRMFLVLRLNGRPIGSSVIFKFPKSRMMTCDMQGLDHIPGRKAKAYFIMLMRSVRMALEEGYDFVDFGPTTLGPKTDAGATLFPCRLGLYASEPFLRVATRLCVSAFASYQAGVADPNASTAAVAKIVARKPKGSLLGGDADSDEEGGGGEDDGADEHDASAALDLVVQIIENKPPPPTVIQSDEDIEVIMAMDPSQMTGSQKKRYNKEKKKRAAKAAKQGGGSGDAPEGATTAAAAAAAGNSGAAAAGGDAGGKKRSGGGGGGGKQAKEAAPAPAAAATEVPAGVPGKGKGRAAPLSTGISGRSTPSETELSSLASYAPSTASPRLPAPAPAPAAVSASAAVSPVPVTPAPSLGGVGGASGQSSLTSYDDVLELDLMLGSSGSGDGGVPPPA